MIKKGLLLFCMVLLVSSLAYAAQPLRPGVYEILANEELTVNDKGYEVGRLDASKNFPRDPVLTYESIRGNRLFNQRDSGSTQLLPYAIYKELLFNSNLFVAGYREGYVDEKKGVERTIEAESGAVKKSYGDYLVSTRKKTIAVPRAPSSTDLLRHQQVGKITSGAKISNAAFHESDSQRVRRKETLREENSLGYQWGYRNGFFDESKGFARNPFKIGDLRKKLLVRDLEFLEKRFSLRFDTSFQGNYIKGYRKGYDDSRMDREPFVEVDISEAQDYYKVPFGLGGGDVITHPNTGRKYQ